MRREVGSFLLSKPNEEDSDDMYSSDFCTSANESGVDDDGGDWGLSFERIV